MIKEYVPLATYLKLEAVKELEIVNDQIDQRIKSNKPYGDLAREHKELVQMAYGTV